MTKVGDSAQNLKRKRIESEMSSPATSTSSKLCTSSGTSWFKTNQLNNFNIIRHKQGYLHFFEVSDPPQIEKPAKDMLEMYWGKTCTEPAASPVQSKLIQDCYVFQCEQSEASVESVADSIFQLFGYPRSVIRKTVTTGQTDTIFGSKDFLLYSLACENKVAICKKSVN